MKTSVSVSVRGCVRNGINVASSTQIIDLDVAQLPEDVREIVAECLCTSHDLQGAVARLDNHGFCHGIGSLDTPDIAGLIVAARKIIAVRADLAVKIAAGDLAARPLVEAGERDLATVVRYDSDGEPHLIVRVDEMRYQSALVTDETRQRAIALDKRLKKEVREPWLAARRAEEAEKAAAKEAAKAAALQAARTEVEQWTAGHGSARLQRCLVEGIECDAIYRDERLALERPGWMWERHVRGESNEPRNPPESALVLLDQARATAPDAQLTYWTADAETDEDGDETADEYRGYLAVCQFLGKDILFQPPKGLIIV